MSEPDSPDDRLTEALHDAREIWSDAILPERVEARQRAPSFAPDSDEDLISLILDTEDDLRIKDNRKYIAAALVLMRRHGIDENSM